MPQYIVNGWKPGSYYASVIVEAATAAEAVKPGLALLDECGEWELTDDGAASQEVDYVEVLNEAGGEPCHKESFDLAADYTQDSARTSADDRWQEKQRKAAAAMLKALRGQLTLLEAYAARLRNVHALMAREMEDDISRLRIAIVDAEYAGITTPEA